MTTSVFDPALRVLSCASCGSPVQGPNGPAASSTPCPRCGVGNAMSPRDDSADQNAARQPAHLSEPQRFQALRAQDGKPLIPPPALMSLLSSGQLNAQGGGLAQQHWQQARQELQQGGSYATAERLYFLALMLYGQLSKEQRDAEVRALLETSLMFLNEPRHRAVLHGMLARNAARVRDFAAANHWLSLCSPTSDDLYIDSSYRLSAAYLAAGQQQYPQVLHWLGTRIDDIPIADTNDLVCGVLRADALEKTGKLEEATQQLAQWLGKNANGVQQIISANNTLGLCFQSMQRAGQQQQQLEQNVVHTKTGLNIGMFVVPVVLGSLAVPLILSVAPQFVGEDNMGIVVGVSVVGLIGLTIGLLVMTAGKMGRAKKRLAESGIRATATLMEASPTGTQINDQPQMALRLKVESLGQPTFIAIHKAVIPQHQLHQMTPGAQLPVMYDPADRAQLVLGSG